MDIIILMEVMGGIIEGLIVIGIIDLIFGDLTLMK